MHDLVRFIITFTEGTNYNFVWIAYLWNHRPALFCRWKPYHYHNLAVTSINTKTSESGWRHRALSLGIFELLQNSVSLAPHFLLWPFRSHSTLRLPMRMFRI
jgi:hypothetical protein